MNTIERTIMNTFGLKINDDWDGKFMMKNLNFYFKLYIQMEN